jgi:hypothetical protein
LAAPAGAAGTDLALIRAGAFAVNAGAVDVYIDGNQATGNVGFEQVTPYAQVAPGSHVVVFRAAGTTDTGPSLASVTASLTPGSASTIALVSQAGGMAASTFSDDLSAPPPADAKVRVIHTVRDVAAVDVFVAPSPPGALQINTVGPTPSGPPAFSALTYGAASPYAKLPAGSYDVQVRAAGSGQLLLSAHSWPVLAGTVASVVVLSDTKGVSLAVVRDAVGASATPTGGMATGAGGAAPRRPAAMGAWLLALATIAVALMIGSLSVVGGRSRRRVRRQGLA